MSKRPSKCQLAEMTYKEAEEAFKSNPVVLVPMGSTEQHGPQCPLGDFRITAALADAVARETSSIVTPVIPYSEGAAARDFAGAIPLRPETLHAIVWDVCAALHGFGLDHIILFCGDHGNVPILERMIRQFKEEHSLRLGMVEPLHWPTKSFLEQVYGVPSPQIAHGGDFITSINLHLFPDDVRLDLMQEPQRKDFQGWYATNFNQLTVDGRTLHMAVDYREISPNGVLGRADMASKDVGAAIMQEFIRTGVDIVNRFRTMRTRCTK